MSESFDVAVIGLGAMGTSACLHLARRGVRVLGLEAGSVPNAAGSSHGHSRMTRLCYYEHPDYVPLLVRAYELWRELEAHAGTPLLHLVGGLYMGPRGCRTVRGAIESARAHRLPHEVLDRAEIARRFPQFRLPEDHEALFEHQAGYLVPERVIAAQADSAVGAGARLHAHEPVRAWARDGGGFRLSTDRGEYRAARLVVTAGVWTNRVLSTLGVRVTPTRQVLAWVRPRKPELFARGVLPVWAIDAESDGLHYGFPMLDDGLGFKVALHRKGPVVDPDVVERGALPGDEETVRGLLRSAIPDADGPLLAIRVCMYENSPDSHFIIDALPEDPGVIIGAGFSGHGFKFASVVGEVLADLAQHGATRHPVQFLGLSRLLA